MTPAQLDEYAENLIARRLSMMNGVARIMVYGAKKYAVRIQADPDKLASRQVDLETVRNAVTAGSVNLPAGALYGQTKAYTVQSNSQLNTAAQFGPLIVAYRNGNPVRLDELGRVIDSVTTSRSTFWINGEQSDDPGGAEATRDEHHRGGGRHQGRAALPAGNPFRPASSWESNLTLRRIFATPIADVKFTLLLTICLVVLVIFFFLRNVSATLIPSLAVPLSLLGTFGAMKLLGFTIDTLSMMAMTLSVGFVVDDAIVMLENIVRHLEMGKSRLAGRLRGRARSGIHDYFDDHVAGGGIYSGAVPGRDYRTAAARVLHYHRGLDPDFGRDFTLADADAVQHLAAAHAARCESLGRPAVLRMVGRFLQLAEQCLPADAGRGFKTPPASRWQASLVLTVATVFLFIVHAQGLHADGRHRHGVWRHRGRAGYFV